MHKQAGLSDEALLGFIREKDAEAFECFFAAHREQVRRHLVSMVRDECAAEDLVQDVFLRVWMHAEQWDGRGSAYWWLQRIATNAALNWLRGQRRHPVLPLDPRESPDDEDLIPGWLIDTATLGPEAVYELNERREYLHRLLDSLPEEKRAVIRLLCEAHLDSRQIAERLSIPEGTVRSRLHYAKKQLVRHLKSAVEK